MTFDEWWNEQDTRFTHHNIRAEIEDVWEVATIIEREACAETAEAAASDANKYDIADAIRMRSN